MNFSVVIPTHNRRHQLIRCINSLLRHPYRSGNVELLVIDNASTDDTLQTTKSLNDLPANYFLRTIPLPQNLGPSRARNVGITAASHSKIILLDDDCSVKTNLLEQYHQAWKRHPQAAAIAGSVVAKYTGKNKLFIDLLHNNYQLWVIAETDYGSQERALRYPEIALSANLSLNKNQIKNPAFHESLGRRYKHFILFGEDKELCLRLHLQHKPIAVVPSITVFNHIDKNQRLNLIYLFKRHILAGAENFIIDSLLSAYTKHIPFQHQITKQGLREIFRLSKPKISWFNFINGICKLLTLATYKLTGTILKLTNTSFTSLR